jgi:hypothetical protein
MRRCYYYSEANTYIKNISLLFNKILKKAKQQNIIPVFSEEYSKRAYVGRNSLHAEDRELFKVVCLRAAMNLDLLLGTFKVIKFMDHYIHKWKIKGYIHATVLYKKTTYNLSLSYKTSFEDDIEFFGINNFLYNKTKGVNHDLIVMDVPQDLFYVIPYNAEDYTIQRGFLTFNKGNKLRLRGKYCSSCANKCKSSFYNGLDRLSLTLKKEVTV